MNRRRPVRRVRVASRPARMRYRTRAAASFLKPLVLAAAAGGALAWGAVAAKDAWTRASWTRVRGVVIVAASPEDTPPPHGFEGAVPVGQGDSLFGFSARRAERELTADFPELKSVLVGRTLGGRVRIVYERRRAAAKVWNNGQWLGMDEDGGVFPLRVFAPENAPPEGVLPEERLRPLPILSSVPSGPAARPLLEFVEILRRLPQSWVKGFYKMKLASSGESVLFLKEGPVVRWGDPMADEAVIRAKAGRLERVLRDPRLAEGADEVRFVDDRRIAVKLKRAG